MSKRRVQLYDIVGWVERVVWRCVRLEMASPGAGHEQTVEESSPVASLALW